MSKTGVNEIHTGVQVYNRLARILRYFYMHITVSLFKFATVNEL
jgi:hypothetical protein